MNIERNNDKILIVADDLTGANDTGVQFSKRELRSLVITNIDSFSRSLKGCDVLVVDTESRFDDKERAYLKSFETGLKAKENNIKYIYKKVDSTFRGNIGAEISGLMDSLEINHAIIVPAMPTYGRITKDGKVYIKGRLLEETEVANDPKTPVRESYIPDIISKQTDKSIAIIHYKDVQAGKDNIINKINENINNGINMMVIDAEENSDLDIIASAITTLKERILFSGSAGLAEYLPKYLDFKRAKKSNFIIAGSVSEVTRRQIEYAGKNLPVKLIDIETERLFSKEKGREKNRIIELIDEFSLKGEDIIIRSASSKEIVDKSFEHGQKYGLDRFSVSETIASFLGEISGHIIQNIDIRGILFTGGDIAIKATQQLNISGTLLKDEIVPGVPYGYFTEEKYKNIIIVSKAGGFGDEDAIYKVLTFLKKQ